MATEYDYQVFSICSEISKQVFPMTLDIDNPKFRAKMERMRIIMDRMWAAKEEGGIMGLLKRGVCGVQAAWTFAGLYFLPTVPNEMPDSIRLQPAW